VCRQMGRRTQDDTACPAGTEAAYADEALTFRFQSDGITSDASDGSLRWEAAVPLDGDLAFTMTRPSEEEAYTVLSSTRSSTAPTPDYSQVSPCAHSRASSRASRRQS
jgi:hypothetical protein